MRDDQATQGKRGAAMHGLTHDAYDQAELLYGEYAKLAKLGDLSLLGSQAEESGTEIIASVSPVLLETYRDGLMG